ncbi:MAG TPA: cyclic pyranopterin monophosphate synthase MoaC [Pirellulales bacterium]
MSKLELSHFDDQGASRMVDVGQKPVTERVARASGVVRMSAATLLLVRDSKLSKKGDVLEVARLAGIMAAKRTAELIPLCHPLPLDSVGVAFTFLDEPTAVASGAGELNAAVRIEAEVHCTGRTGIEMEALTAVSIAALTIYDMCKSAERGMVIERIQLEEKTGGKSGKWNRAE